jgi:long-subunit fatty acid transport protein
MIVAVALAAGPAAAQTDYEITSALQFNFSNPGAKSLAMGGALTGLADDATGAWTNPAGLLNLSRPEMSLEFRAFEYANVFTSSGHAFGTPANVGVNTTTGLHESQLVDRASALAFVSVVLPRERWALAFYRNQAAKFRTRISTDGVFIGSAPFFRRLRPVEGHLELDVAAYGASAATRVGDRVSFGAGLSVYDFSIDSLVERVSTTRVAVPTEPGGFFGPPLRTSDNVVNIERQTGSNLRVGVNVGLSVDVSPAIRLGASFRQGPVFQFDVQRLAGPGSATPGLIEVDRRGTFHLPDVYTAGVLLRPVPPLSTSGNQQTLNTR